MPQRAQDIIPSVDTSDLSDIDTRKPPRQGSKRNPDFGARLKSRIEELERTEKGVRSRIARDIGASKQIITDWQNGVTPSADTLFRLADALEIDPRWLISGAGRPRAQEDDSQWLRLPLHDLFGFGESGKPEAEETVPVRKDWLLGNMRNFSNLWLAEMPSDAMPDVAREGEMIVCRDPDIPLADGRVYVLQLDGRPIVRRVQVRPEGLVLKAGSPHIDPITIAEDRIDTLVPVGRVMMSINLKAV